MADHAIIDLQEDGLTRDDVSQWTPSQVATWLEVNGYQEHKAAVCDAHNPVDGQRLLSLTSADLRTAPFNMANVHEIDHLHSCIESLRKSQLTKYLEEHNGIRNGYRLPASRNQAKMNGSIPNGFAHSASRLENGDVHQYADITTPLIRGDDIIRSSTSGSTIDLYPPEKIKCGVAFLYMMFGFIASVFTLQVVHDRVPDMAEEPPLPDIFFDLVPRRVEGAFRVCETIGMVLTAMTLLLAVFLKHRFIVVRRIFFIVGTLYLYRCVTMFVTTLPVPGLHFKCAPKTHGQISLMLIRAASVLIGGGLTVTGSHLYCGDYLFSGHTVVLTICYLCISEYTPRRWWWLHWATWTASAVGIVCILLAHDHYTVDVVVAYLLTTRIFWTYHSMCNVAALKEASNANLLSRAWWFPFFRYLEGNVSANGALPRQYEWPLPWPKRLRSGVLPGKRSLIKGV